MNRMKNSSLPWHRWFGIGCGVTAITLSGCGMEPETFSRIEEMAKTSRASFSNVNEPFGEGLPVTSESQTFSVPFPHRRDPFRVSETGTAAAAQPVGAANISVIGFAKVGQQQAILRIAEKTQFVIVGDKIGELEVLGITPPRVRLKHGNLVWDASMFSNHAASRE